MTVKNNTNQEHQWYVLNVHSGKEEFVSNEIKNMIKTLKLERLISEVFIPTQNKVVITSKGKEIKKEKIFKGYILVKMIYNQQTAPLLTNIEQVRGFVRTGNEVVPLMPAEVTNLTKEDKGKKASYKISLRVNDAIKIKDGMFKEFIGKVSGVDEDKGKVKVLITFLGREVPYELDVAQVEKL